MSHSFHKNYGILCLPKRLPLEISFFLLQSGLEAFLAPLDSALLVSSLDLFSGSHAFTFFGLLTCFAEAYP